VASREEIRALQRELGNALKQARQSAGWSQSQLSRRLLYARSSVSTVESGSQNMRRERWELCDELLNAGGTLTAGYDRLAAAVLACRAEADPAATISEVMTGLGTIAAQAPFSPERVAGIAGLLGQLSAELGRAGMVLRDAAAARR
jgi:transcriptional regulator with XRE-family HTH domain